MQKTIKNLWALILLAPFPSVGVLMALSYANGPIGSALWGFAKIWVLAFPLLWFVYIDRQKVAIPKIEKKDWLIGLTVGALMFASILISYYVFARGNFDSMPMRDLLFEAGLNNPLHYLLMATYWSFANSLVEEYVFRWFIYLKAEPLLGRSGAVICSALIFTAHHSVALSFYVPWQLNLLASLGVFFAAIIWSAMYAKLRNIWAGYISHVMADIAIFSLGYFLLFGN